jgi:hypothetical protein
MFCSKVYLHFFFFSEVQYHHRFIKQCAFEQTFFQTWINFRNIVMVLLYSYFRTCNKVMALVIISRFACSMFDVMEIGFCPCSLCCTRLCLQLLRFHLQLSLAPLWGSSIIMQHYVYFVPDLSAVQVSESVMSGAARVTTVPRLTYVTRGTDIQSRLKVRSAYV